MKKILEALDQYRKKNPGADFILIQRNADGTSRTAKSGGWKKGEAAELLEKFAKNHREER